MELKVGDFRARVDDFLDLGRQAVRVGSLLYVFITAILTHYQVEAITIHAGFIRHQLDQVNHEPGSITGLQHYHTGGVAVR